MLSSTIGRIDWFECNDGIGRTWAGYGTLQKTALIVFSVSLLGLLLSIPFALTIDIQRNLFSFIVFYCAVGSSFVVSFVILIVTECKRCRNRPYESINN